jgi:hypothetical protein
MKMDASRGAIRMVLKQKGLDKKLQPITFYSQQITNMERRYDTHDQEALAIMEGFKK